MRRSQARKHEQHRTVPTYVEAPCDTCGKAYQWLGSARTCEQCAIRADGTVPRGTCANGSVPVLYRLHNGAGRLTVYQRCNDCDRACELSELEPTTGRCDYCARPGVAVRSVAGSVLGKVYGGALFVPDGRGHVLVTVPLQADGTVRAWEYNQGCGPERELSVRLGDLPAWGYGWQVETSDGSRRWWLTHWDSSD